MKNLFTNLRSLLLLFTCILAVQQTTAQDSTKNKLTISGYAEIFYTYDFAKPENHIRHSFLYTYNRHNTLSLNLGLLKANFNNDKVRGNVALMAGTYTSDNMAAEPVGLKNIYEANAGVKISKHKDIWIDAGILPSHIGWESAIGKDCPTLTRTIAAENSPYFETGARISYNSANGKWYLAGLVLNGWQRIERISGNNTPALGHQITYKPASKITLNSSSFIGNDKPDSVKQMRYFHDMYAQWALTDKLSLTLGFDIGAEQKSKGSSQFNTWYSPNLIVQIKPSNAWSIGLRLEKFVDKKGVIIPIAIGTGTPNGFTVLGYSLNIDRLIINSFMWRTELRGLSSKEKIFWNESSASSGNFSISTSISYWF